MPQPTVEAPADSGPPPAQRVDPFLSWVDGTQLCAQVDADVFYPRFEHGDDATSTSWMWALARRVCERCPLQDLCALHALRHGEYGVWGATSETSREEIKQRACGDWSAITAAVEARVAANVHVQARRRSERDAAA